jgi:hypothetical protein
MADFEDLSQRETFTEVLEVNVVDGKYKIVNSYNYER